MPLVDIVNYLHDAPQSHRFRILITIFGTNTGVNPMFLSKKKLLVLVIAILPFAQGAIARTEQKAPEPIHPIRILLEDGKREILYPSVAGNFIVYSQLANNEYSVVRVSKDDLHAQGRVIAPAQPNEAIQYGVAISDGSVGYVSNRMGPIAAWMKQAEGDGHVAIGNISTFTGSLMPMHLKATTNGTLWCFDSTLENMRRARLLDDFSDVHKHTDLLAQSWRLYHSDFWRHQQGYKPSKTGTENDFQAPALFIFERGSSQLTMFPDAYDGALSPDGNRIVFVREVNGNFDLWMQDIQGKGLTQLTTSEFGDFEPAFSPDGNKLAFVSNRDSKGEVELTSIYVIDLNSGKIDRLTNAPMATDGGPAWLDDNTIIFHSNRDPQKPQEKVGSSWNLWEVKLK